MKTPIPSDRQNKGNPTKTVVLIILSFAALGFMVFGASRFYKSYAAASLTKKGIAAIENGDLESAERFFHEALRRNPAYNAARLNLGATLEKQGNYKEAIDAYSTAIRKTRKGEIHNAARFRLAMIYSNTAIQPPVRKKDWSKKAVELLEELAADEPGNPEYHLYLGFAAFNDVNPGMGLAELKKASELATKEEHIRIHEKLLEFYLQINMKDRAEEERKKIEARNVPEK